MRALSIRQPWPWLITRPDVTDPVERALLYEREEIKIVENRTWRTLYRGPILLHAGEKVDRVGYDWVRECFPEIPLPSLTALERGGVVGDADLVDCVSWIRSRWFNGPLGFVLSDARPLPFQRGPGKLGLFEWRPTP